MKKIITATITLIAILVLAYAVTYAWQQPSQPSESPVSDDIGEQAAEQRYLDLLDRYQTALADANNVIDEMNDDIAIAQSLDALDELEAHVDAMPLRDTIAHPQP